MKDVAQALVASGKGILAADESSGTIKKRFDTIGLESSEENHRQYRQLLFTTPLIENFISGVILFDETICQKTDNGMPFPKYLADRGIIPGIKVDKGTVELEKFSGEKITEGLDGLRDRLAEYGKLGAKFSKWRAVITIGDNIPSDVCVGLNVEFLARFAALSQEAGLVPIVEPEVLMDGSHSIAKSEDVNFKVIKNLFVELEEHKVDLGATLLKPSFVHPGKENKEKITSAEVAQRTLSVLQKCVPTEVPGIVFLSGGDGPQESTDHLNEINKLDKAAWEISFSFGRALQEPVLKTWMGKQENLKAAQEVFYKRAKLNSLARFGKYSTDLESKNA